MVPISVRSKLIVGFSIALLSSVVIGYMSMLSLNTVYSEMSKYMGWGKVDEVMNEAVTQRVLVLDKILALKTLRNNDELLTRVAMAFASLDEGVAEWSTLLEGRPELEGAAETVQKKIDNIKNINAGIDDLTVRLSTLEDEWDGLVNDMLTFLNSTMEDVIDPAKVKAEKSGDIPSMQRWSMIDMIMNEGVIANVLKLKTASHDFAADTSEENWRAYNDALTGARDGLAQWRTSFGGVTAMNTAAAHIEADLDEYTDHGNEYKGLVDEKKTAATSADETILLLLTDLKNIMEKHVDPAKSATIAKAESVKAQASSAAMTVLLIAGLVVICIGIIIYRSISVPLKKAMIFSVEIAKGNLNAELNVSKGDEIGKMCDALAEVPKVLKMIMGRITHTTEEIEVGNLRDHIPEEGLQGEFQVLVKRVNRCSESYLEFMDAIPLPLMAINLEHTILYLNKTAQEVGGFENREQYHGKTHCWDVFKTSDCQTDNCACAKTMKTMNAESSETDAHPQDMDLDIKYMAIPITNSAGRVCGAFEVVIDQTDIVRMQRKVATLVEQASGISTKLAESSQSLSSQIDQANRGASVQSERTTETATAMEEMNATVMEVAQNASRAAENTSLTMEKALEGKSSVDSVELAIGKVHRQTQTLKDDMVTLGTQTEGIGTVIEVISDIADQTNLLALNAAIEAARAGEAGRGFAVVADEVRKLAEKTMGATTEVINAISTVQQSCKRNIEATDTAALEVNKSTSLADKAGSILAEIVEYAEDSSGQVQSIATASEEQSAAAEEISRSTEDVNRISQETGQAMNDAARSVTQVNDMVQALDELIQQMV